MKLWRKVKLLLLMIPYSVHDYVCIRVHVFIYLLCEGKWASPGYHLPLFKAGSLTDLEFPNRLSPQKARTSACLYLSRAGIVSM